MPDLAKDRATQEAILAATIAAWRPAGSAAGAKLTGAIDPAGWDASVGVHDHARARPEAGDLVGSRRHVVHGGVVGGSSRPARAGIDRGVSPAPDLPSAPPFAIRARVITPLAGRSDAGPRGRARRGRRRRGGSPRSAKRRRSTPVGCAAAVDLRPWVVLPGMVDLHAHLPQVPNAGLGFALPLLDWLDRLTFPTERSWADPAVAERLAPAIFRAFAAAGTTTVLAYGVVYEAAMDAAFRAAEAHGIRAILGKVMMDRITYDPTIEPSTILERSLRESRAPGRALARGGRRAARLRGHAAVRDLVHGGDARASRRPSPATRLLVADPRLARTRARSPRSRRLFPEARDYVDVYDRAGGLGPRTILAHAIHLSPREEARLAETGTRVAHCPTSNLFLGAGVMPLASRLAAGPVGRARVGRVGRPGALDLRRHADRAPTPSRRGGRCVDGRRRAPALGPLDWLRLGTLDGARALGLDGSIGSLEAGKEADLIAVDPARRRRSGAELDDDADRLADARRS